MFHYSTLKAFIKNTCFIFFYLYFIIIQCLLKSKGDISLCSFVSTHDDEREEGLKLWYTSCACSIIASAQFSLWRLFASGNASRHFHAFYRVLLHVESIAIARASFRGRVLVLNARGMKLRYTVAHACFHPTVYPRFFHDIISRSTEAF